jgi:hypothetical protein
MMNTAIGRGWTKTAMALVRRQTDSRAALVTERQQAAERLADLKVQGASIEAQRVRRTAETLCSDLTTMREWCG